MSPFIKCLCCCLWFNLFPGTITVHPPEVPFMLEESSQSEGSCTDTSCLLSLAWPENIVLIISIKIHYHLTPANYLISLPSMKITFIIRMTSWTLFKNMEDSERFKIKSTFWLLFTTVEKLGLRLFTYKKKFNTEWMTARFINWLSSWHQFEETAFSRSFLTTHKPSYLTYSPKTYVNCNMWVDSTPM